jgi:predicted dehydrogenase
MTRWGIMGAGEIARVFANGVRFSRTGRVVAVASMTSGRGESLAQDFSIPRCYASYPDLLADEEVDAVYVSLIHPHHARWAIAAAAAGKHVLVEKPMAMN